MKGGVDDLSDMRKKLWETLGEKRARNGIKFTGLKGHIFQNSIYLCFSDRLEGKEGDTSELRVRRGWLERSLVKFSTEVVNLVREERGEDGW